jgi:uncharacterized membrane protein YoaT (DUF817 family)
MRRTFYTVDSTIRSGERVWIVFMNGCSYGQWEYSTQQEAWDALHALRAQTTGRG